MQAVRDDTSTMDFIVMTINVVVCQATNAPENRVALVPSSVASLRRLGLCIQLQQHAGDNAGYPDNCYTDVSFFAASQRTATLAQADIIVTLHMPSTAEINHYKKGALLVGLLTPERCVDVIPALTTAHVTSFALEWLPRITRAQSMDVLSSQATAAGYKAALLAAQLSTRFFPMLTTAAGTIKPAIVLVVGAGVAGLQAIATAKRLGAIVYAYDVRSHVREQVASLGAQMIDTGICAEGSGGYARILSSEEQQQQQAVLAEYVAKSNVIITTAAVPGRAAPRIITQTMLDTMQAGSVIVDLAAETGGNCVLTEADKTIVYRGVTICGPLNLASQLAQHASDMYSRNVCQFMQLLYADGQLTCDWQDPILAETQVTHAGQVSSKMDRLITGNT